jgi:hypothetical protein
MQNSRHRLTVPDRPEWIAQGGIWATPAATQNDRDTRRRHTKGPPDTARPKMAFQSFPAKSPSDLTHSASLERSSSRPAALGSVRFAERTVVPFRALVGRSPLRIWSASSVPSGGACLKLGARCRGTGGGDRLSNPDKVLEALRQRGPLSDPEPVEAAGVRPHQQVNQICRRLEAAAVLPIPPSSALNDASLTSP